MRYGTQVVGASTGGSEAACNLVLAIHPLDVMNHRPPVGQPARAGNAQSLEFVMRHGHHQSVVQATIGQGARQGDTVLALRLSAEGWETERQEQEYMSLPKVISLYTTLASRCKLPIFLRRWQNGLGWGGAEGS